MAVIECVDLSKAYGRGVMALKELTLSVEEGVSFGLLGENGAGKSTLVRIIMGFIFPTAGRVRVFGEERVARVHGRIGYVHERPIFENRFTGRDYLAYMGQLSGMWGDEGHERVAELLERVNLREAADRTIGTYSKGMMQRLAIAQALLMEPELLILDEPTSGLDPRSQWEVRQIIAGLRRQGKTMLICSHYLVEVEALCDAVGILRRGELILSGTVTDLLRSQGVVEIVLGGDEAAGEVARRLHIEGQVMEARDNVLRVADVGQQAVLAALVNANVPIVSLNPVSRTLEEVYVRTTEMVDNAAGETRRTTDIAGGAGRGGMA